eukprot:SAG22_NODE_11632_length_476_cov_0.816976_1_plen_44_part_10
MYLNSRFCSDWTSFISPQRRNEAGTLVPGNIIEDGGSDMYDFGN